MTEFRELRRHLASPASSRGAAPHAEISRAPGPQAGALPFPRLARSLLLAVCASASLTGFASARDVTIGYLGLENDPRYQPDVVYTRLEIAPGGNPVVAARMGIEDLQMVTDAVDLKVTLDEQTGADAATLAAKVKAMSDAGENFIIVDLPGDVLDQVAAQTKDLPVTLVNATAPDDLLRNRCYPNLLHTAASDRMDADAMVQYLRTRNWTKVLILVGPLDRDKAMADAFRASAERQRFNIVDTREFTLAADPANREKNNPLLLTGGVDYDVVYIADNQGEYARYLPYATQLPRLVVGATGLVSSEWNWTFERYGAPQVVSRFADLADGRHMTGQDWSTWIAAKAIVTAYAKARSEDPAKIVEYMRGNRFKIDGSKGVQLNFRSWDGQLRQPIVLATTNAVIEMAPLDGFLHQTNTLDTLGTDEPEHKCQ